MDFLGNTFTVQDQEAYMLYLEQKINGKNFWALLKQLKILAEQNFPRLRYLTDFNFDSAKTNHFHTDFLGSMVLTWKLASRHQGIIHL